MKSRIGGAIHRWMNATRHAQPDGWFIVFDTLTLGYCRFFFSSRRRHTRFDCDWSSDVCSSDLGYALGYLLAALCYFFVYPHWGWRPLFFIGGLPALLALFVRARVRESEVWQQTRHDNWLGLGRAIAANWKVFLYLTVLMAMMNMVSHRAPGMYPTFL